MSVLTALMEEREAWARRQNRRATYWSVVRWVAEWTIFIVLLLLAMYRNEVMSFVRELGGIF